MNTNDIKIKAKALAQQLRAEGRKVTIKDVTIVLQCQQKAMAGVPNPWAEAWKTKLYQKQGCTYCRLQELI